MKGNWWMRFALLAFVGSISLVMVIPTVFDLEGDSSYPVKSKINLGLDLQGGLYMILGIDFDRVYADEIRNYARRVQALLKDRGMELEVLPAVAEEHATTETGDPRVSLRLLRPQESEQIKAEVRSSFPGHLRLTGESAGILTYALANVVKTRIEEQAVGKSIEVIRNRIDEFGVTEPEIFSQGKDRIVVQLPGVRDIARAKELIGRTAKLQFQMANDTVSQVTVQGWLRKAEEADIRFEKGMRFSDYLKRLNQFLAKDLPEGHTLAFQRNFAGGGGGQDDMIPFVLENNSELDGEALQDARVQVDQQQNRPYVSLEFKSAGARIFERLTGENVGRRMAIVLDGNVYSAPNINERIGGGRAQITLGGGAFNRVMREASDLALVLRAGALPVPLEFEEQRVVGPSLGRDSIEKARYASLIGALAVFLFILFYYRLSGGIATTTLLLNILIVLACLVSFEATLTLPGIAGIALTIGMAVDANIIIYERIREEVRKGLSCYKAVESGFSHAFWTILDANITTALAGLCLLNFGTGPIRGFAVTLLVGIVATVYSSYFVGKLLFEFYMHSTEGQKLSI